MRIVSATFPQTAPHTAINGRWRVLAFLQAILPRTDRAMQHGREALLRQFHHLYDQCGELDDPCAYCGVASDSWDHVPPLHYIARITPDQRAQYRLRLIPVCRQCNGWLTGLILNTLQERREAIRRKLRRKYAKVLRLPAWDEADLAELSTKLADDIRRHLNLADHVRKRIGFFL